MSRYFDASGEVINCGSGAALDDLPGSSFSGCAWVRRDTDAYNQVVFGKGDWTTSGWSLIVDGQAPFTGDIYGGPRFYVAQDGNTVADDYQAPIDTVPDDTWTFIAFSYNPAGSAGAKAVLYDGVVGTIVGVSTLTKNDDGGGTYDVDAAEDFQIGNQATDNMFRGDISRCAIYSGILTLADFQKIQYGSVAAWNRSDCLGLWLPEGSTTVPDLSGNGHTGTVTGATVSENPPLRSPYWFGEAQDFDGAAAPGGGGRNLTLLGVGA